MKEETVYLIVQALNLVAVIAFGLIFVACTPEPVKLIPGKPVPAPLGEQLMCAVNPESMECRDE